MSALGWRAAFTGARKIVKFDGCYHGHADMLLVQAGSGVATLGLPDSPGVPAAPPPPTARRGRSTISMRVQRAARAATSSEIAAIIVEPVVGNMGCVAPRRRLSARRCVAWPTEHGALLIFDEVMTGFRVATAARKRAIGVKPDLTCLGKVIGGGLPVGGLRRPARRSCS